MTGYATKDLEIGGQTVCAGEPVLVALGAANRDPRRFTDPDQPDPLRDCRSHLAFGHGIHHCVVAALARVELREALLALSRELPDLRLADAVTWKRGAFLRGPAVVPVTW